MDSEPRQYKVEPQKEAQHKLQGALGRRELTERIFMAGIEPENAVETQRAAEMSLLRETLLKRLWSAKRKDNIPFSFPLVVSVLAGLYFAWKVFRGALPSDAIIGPSSFTVLAWSYCFAYNAQVEHLPELRRLLAKSGFAWRVLSREIVVGTQKLPRIERLFGLLSDDPPPFGSSKWIDRLAAEQTDMLGGSLPLRRKLLLPMLLFFFAPFISVVSQAVFLSFIPNFGLYVLVCLSIAAFLLGYRFAQQTFEEGLLVETLADELGIAPAGSAELHEPLATRMRKALRPFDASSIAGFSALFVVFGMLLLLLSLGFGMYWVAVFYVAASVAAFIWSCCSAVALDGFFEETISRAVPLRRLAEDAQSGSLIKRAREFLKHRQKILPELRRRPLRRHWITGTTICAVLPMLLELLGKAPGAHSAWLLILATVVPWLLALLFNEMAASEHQRNLLVDEIILPLEEGLQNMEAAPASTVPADPTAA